LPKQVLIEKSFDIIMQKIKKFISNKKVSSPFKKYTVIIGGSPSKGARSPKLWNAAFKLYKIKNSMLPLDVTSKNLTNLLKALERDKNFIGGCVTIPHKESVSKWLKKRLTLTSKKIGAVNCLFRDKNGRLVGTNTDGEASIKSFKKKFGSVKNKKILLIGVGGAGKAVAAYFSGELKRKNNLTISGRSNNSMTFAKKIKAKWIHYKKLKKLNLNSFEIIINCTSLGFGKNENLSPILSASFKSVSKKACFFDIIYKPKITKFLSLAKKNKKKILNGLDMNLRQAVIAFGFVNRKTKTNSSTLRFMRSA